jgi:hypothetical protein
LTAIFIIVIQNQLRHWPELLRGSFPEGFTHSIQYTWRL